MDTKHLGDFKKTMFTDDPRTKYCFENSEDLHPAQKKLIEASMKHPMKIMIGSSDIMQLCTNLIKLIKGKNVLDVGLFTGMSALTWALAVPADGHVTSMDIDDKAYNEIGKKIVEEAGLANKVKIHIQPATDTLDKLIKEGKSGTFDFAFIDADKENYINYYQKCMQLLRPGGIIAVDNAIWGGSVYQEPKDEQTTTIDNLNKLIKKDERVNSTLLPIGDGLHLAFKK